MKKRFKLLTILTIITFMVLLTSCNKKQNNILKTSKSNVVDTTTNNSNTNTNTLDSDFEALTAFLEVPGVAAGDLQDRTGAVWRRAGTPGGCALGF